MEALFPADAGLPEPLPVAFEAVQVALEELHVAEEELRQQNEELSESRRALEAERQRYQELFAFAPDGYLITDLDGAIREANRAAGELLGIEPRFLIGKPLPLFVPQEERPAFRRELRRLRQVGRIQECEVSLQPRHGEPLAAAITAETILDRDGRPAEIRWLLRDISARKRAEARLRRAEAARAEAEAARLVLLEADQQKNEFLAMLAHELRNPLAPILTAVRLLELTDTPDARQRRAREIIERQVRHQARLIDDLLDVSRITHGKIALRRQACDLKEAMAQAVEEHRPAIEARSQSLTLQLPEETAPLPVDGDPVRLEQVIGNLLANASRYTDPGGEIALSACREAGAAVVRVRDTGVGIDPELLPRVFDLFVQGETGLDRRGGGLGVGLTLVKRLVELHGGTVEARSAGPGRGSEFVVRLPILGSDEGVKG